jgi:multidrug resistance protein, MATE family
MIFRKKWAYMFNSDPDVVQEVAHILPLVALFQIFDGLGAITGAILRAKGQQDVGAVLTFLGYYTIGIPFGLILAFRAGLGLEGLWIGLTVALVVVGLTGLYSELIDTNQAHLSLKFPLVCTIRTNWDVEVEKAMTRLGYHDVPSDDSTRSSTVVA